MDFEKVLKLLGVLRDSDLISESINVDPKGKITITIAEPPLTLGEALRLATYNFLRREICRGEGITVEDASKEIIKIVVKECERYKALSEG